MGLFSRRITDSSGHLNRAGEKWLAKGYEKSVKEMRREAAKLQQKGKRDQADWLKRDANRLEAAAKGIRRRIG